MTKSIKIKDATHKRLRVLQAHWELRSIDAALQQLLLHAPPATEEPPLDPPKAHTHATGAKERHSSLALPHSKKS